MAEIPYEVLTDTGAIPVSVSTHEWVTCIARVPVGRRATIRHTGGPRASVSLFPARNRPDLEVRDDTVSVEVTDPAPRIVRVEGLPYLFILPVPAVDAPVDGRIDIPPEADDAATHTDRIQTAIDDVSRSGGGTIHLEAGTHLSKQLTLRSRVRLDLHPDARLRGTGIPADYEASHGRRTLILVDRAEDAAILGQGIIDGRGHVLQKEHGTKAHLIDAVDCRNLTLEDVTLLDPGAWTLHLIGCENVDIRRLKILGDWGLANTDGIDPDMSRNVTIENCFVYAGDDAIVVKATGACGVTGPSENIVARNCLLMTRKTALKIGTESRFDIRDVLYEDIEIVDSARACALWMRDGATYSDITFRNVTANLMRLPREQWSGEAYRISIEERDGRGTMRDIRFENVRIASPQRSILFSTTDDPVTGITFDRCVWIGDTLDDIPHIQVDNAEDITLHNCTLDLAGDAHPFPRDLLRGTTPDAVTIE